MCPRKKGEVLVSLLVESLANKQEVIKETFDKHTPPMGVQRVRRSFIASSEKAWWPRDKNNGLPILKELELQKIRSPNGSLLAETIFSTLGGCSHGVLAPFGPSNGNFLADFAESLKGV